MMIKKKLIKHFYDRVDLMSKHILHRIIIKKRSNHNVKKIIQLLVIITKYLIPIVMTKMYKERIKKRPCSSNKYKTISDNPK